MKNDKDILAILKERLAHLPLGEIEYYDSIGSTNDRAAIMAEEESPPFSVVIANEQTKGRGRSGRRWYTPPNAALAFTILLRPSKGMGQKELKRLSGLGALAVARAIKSSVGLDAEIKWPNDVLINGQKVCGVLSEAHWIGDSLEALILGIGVNIAKNAVPPDEQLNFPATYLEKTLAQKLDSIQILEAILKQIISLWPRVGEDDFIKDWESSLAFRGEEVQLLSGKEIAITGVIKGLTDNGELIIRNKKGEDKIVQVGEIHLRPNIDKLMN